MKKTKLIFMWRVLEILQKEKQCVLFPDLHDMGSTFEELLEKSLKSQLKMADKFDARWTLILGNVEVRENIIILRDMKEGVQERIPFDGILDRMKELLVDQSADTWKMENKSSLFSYYTIFIIFFFLCPQ